MLVIGPLRINARALLGSVATIELLMGSLLGSLWGLLPDGLIPYKVGLCPPSGHWVMSAIKLEGGEVEKEPPVLGTVELLLGPPNELLVKPLAEHKIPLPVCLKK